MFKLDLEPLAPRLLHNREAHIDYLKYTQEQADILREIVEQAKVKQPLGNELDFACKHAQRIQELLVYVRETCPNVIKLSTKKVAITPKNNVKKVRFIEPLTSSSSIKQVESSTTSDSNIPVNMKNKVEAQPRKVNKKNHVVEPIRDVDVKHSPLKANSELICATCHVLTEVGLKWKPTGRTFTIVGSSKKAKIVESKNANHSKPNHTWGSNATDIPSSSSLVMTGTVRFGNDHIARIMRFGDYQLGNGTISTVYYVEGLGHNLFSVSQFCDVDLEVAFWKNTYFIRNLKGVDLLSGSQDTNLYTISLVDMLKTSPICLLSKASKTKSWLWHRRLSHLNFACSLGKSKKSSHQPKAEDTNQEKLYLLHMDLCGPMRVASINGKKVYISDYRRLLKIYLDNGTEFVNQTLHEFYENVGISHQTSVPYNPQQNDVVERQNRTLIEVARTMLIFSKAPFALCYPTNDNDNLGKLDARADIAMASEQFSLGPGLHSMTHATSSSGIVPNPIPQQPCIPPPRDDWDRLFQPRFDEYFTPSSITVSLVQEADASRVVVLADSPVSTSIDWDGPSSSTPSTQKQEQSPNISQGFEESPKTPIFRDDLINESPHRESTS
ncbi:retrovirus-related pol polyprotein from transposon TNT 1-94 [Tanacetum coccineum]